MSTNLQLCQKLHRYARMDASKVGTRPTTVVGATDEDAEIVGFINDAYEDIQRIHDEWAFRVKQSTFNLVAGTRAYSRATIQATITDYDQVLPFRSRNLLSSFVLLHTTSVGVSDQQPCYFIPYEEWRGYDDIGTRPSGRPYRFTQRPDMTLEFDGTPDVIYTVTLDYRRTLHTLTTDSDATTGTPIIPAQFHDIIMWKALQLYCDSRDGTEALYAKSERNYKQLLFALRRNQLPMPTMAVVGS